MRGVLHMDVFKHVFIALNMVYILFLQGNTVYIHQSIGTKISNVLEDL
jgi:hypothetical protein